MTLMSNRPSDTGITRVLREAVRSIGQLDRAVKRAPSLGTLRWVARRGRRQRRRQSSPKRREPRGNLSVGLSPAESGTGRARDRPADDSRHARYARHARGLRRAAGRRAIATVARAPMTTTATCRAERDVPPDPGHPRRGETRSRRAKGAMRRQIPRFSTSSEISSLLSAILAPVTVPQCTLGKNKRTAARRRHYRRAVALRYTARKRHLLRARGDICQSGSRRTVST